MTPAQTILALVQLGKLGMDVWEDYQRGDLTDEMLDAAWDKMQDRLEPISQRAQS